MKSLFEQWSFSTAWITVVYYVTYNRCSMLSAQTEDMEKQQPAMIYQSF